MEQKSTQLLSGFSALIELLESKETLLQAFRETLTTRLDFNPYTLFRYASHEEQHITKRSIAHLLAENGFMVTYQQVKLLFSTYGYKDRLDFNAFLNFLFPSCIDTLKQISTVTFKKYSSKKDDQILEEVVCIFVHLIKQEVQFLHEFDELKKKVLSEINKVQIRKLIRGIKKISQKKVAQETASDNILTYPDLKAMLQKSLKMSDYETAAIYRRLTMSKDVLNADQLQFWLKPWLRMGGQCNQVSMERSVGHTLFEDVQASLEVMAI